MKINHHARATGIAAPRQLRLSFMSGTASPFNHAPPNASGAATYLDLQASIRDDLHSFAITYFPNQPAQPITNVPRTAYEWVQQNDSAIKRHRGKWVAVTND